jgi:hypothetical protein
VDYNPASVGQLPNESTAVIIFERPDGDRNYVARDFSSSRFPRASCSACHGLETPTQNDVEGREIDFLAVLGRVEPVRVYEIIAPAGCLSAAEQELCGLFAEGLATYRARDWDQSERCFAQCLAVMPRGSWRAVGAERPDRDAASPETEGSNPVPSSKESCELRYRDAGARCRAGGVTADEPTKPLPT